MFISKKPMVSVITLLVLFAFTDLKAAQRRGRDGQLKLLYWQAPSLLNPYLASGTKDVEAASLILEPLAHYDENGNMVPVLVEEIPTVKNGGIASDLKSITWKIKKGILWSDGTPLTAHDVVFTGEYCLHPDIGCSSSISFKDVQSLEAIDDYTLRITFSIFKPFPYGPFVGSDAPVLQKAQFANCLGKKAHQCTSENFSPIGTGPFKVVEFRTNDVADFVANEKYRDPHKPAFARLLLKGGGDAVSAARAVLETGEFHYSWNLQVDPEVLALMENSGKGQIVTSFGSNVEHLMINLTNDDYKLGEDHRSLYKDGNNPNPILDDPSVRRALSLAIDRQILVDIGYGSSGQPACNILTAPAIYASTANDQCLKQNIPLANKILDDAGWVLNADGVRTKKDVRLSLLYQTSTNAVRQDTQVLIKQMWEQIGVETELRNINASVFFGGDPSVPDTVGKFYADVQMYTNGSSIDPEDYMTNWMCDEIPGPENKWLKRNIPRYCNPEYDKLVMEMKGTASLNKRATLAKRMNDILIQNYIVIPLISRGSVSAHVRGLKGVRMNTWDSELWNIANWHFTD